MVMQMKLPVVDSDRPRLRIYKGLYCEAEGEPYSSFLSELRQAHEHKSLQSYKLCKQIKIIII